MSEPTVLRYENPFTPEITHTEDDILNIRSVHNGDASPAQQRAVLAFIIARLSRLGLDPHSPGDPHQTAYNIGAQSIGRFLNFAISSTKENG